MNNSNYALKANFAKRKWFKKGGFTLIELLVVISIIGMLSSVVMASLQGARKKAQYASVVTFDRHTYAAFYGDLVAAWDFNDATFPGKDISGNSNDFPYISTVVPSDRGDGGMILNCNATSPAYCAGQTSSTQLSLKGMTNVSAMTHSLWIKYTSSGPNCRRISLFGSWANNGSFIVLNNCDGVGANSRPVFGISNGAAASTLPTATFSTDNTEWHHLAATYDGDRITLYIDGKQTSSVNAGDNIIISQLFSLHNNNQYIDDVRIYKKALPIAAIQELYAEGIKDKGLAIDK